MAANVTSTQIFYETTGPIINSRFFANSFDFLKKLSKSQQEGFQLIPDP